MLLARLKISCPQLSQHKSPQASPRLRLPVSPTTTYKEQKDLGGELCKQTSLHQLTSTKGDSEMGFAIILMKMKLPMLLMTFSFTSAIRASTPAVGNCGKSINVNHQSIAGGFEASHSIW